MQEKITTLANAVALVQLNGSGTPALDQPQMLTQSATDDTALGSKRRWVRSNACASVTHASWENQRRQF